MVSLWDINEFICIRTFASLEYKFGIFYKIILFIRYPIRSISFSYDGQLIALASEDTFIDIVIITFFYKFFKKIIKSLMLKQENKYILFNKIFQ